MVNATIAEEFAVSVVKKLRDAGFESLWAGGCVRDRLLNRTPKDYDVATNATPDQVCEIFGKRRTLRIGDAFGVVAVLAKKPLQPIEVATFRRESGYADGRHPDHVEFSSAMEDAKRRDFTINGMFFDPLSMKVIDYVGGESDLVQKVIRCIGDPEERFNEDRLRMLRAIRFAAAFDFQIESATMTAVKKNARYIGIISAERIANEMRRMMSHPNASVALQYLESTDLRRFVIREFEDEAAAWDEGLRIVRQLTSKFQPPFELTCAAMLSALPHSQRAAKKLSARWKLANAERDRIVGLLNVESAIRNAASRSWPSLQRMLIQPLANDAVELANAIAECRNESTTGIEICRAKLAMPSHLLNPAPLVSGDDLVEAGVRPGPLFRTILEQVRDRQLDGEIVSFDQAMALAIELARQ